jgi:hypothetical protein
MTDLDILESRLQGLERRMHRVGHLRPRLGAGVVVALAPVGDTRTMTRALRRHRSDHYARRVQRTHLRQVHHDGTLDCIGEQRVWYFEKRTSLGHAQQGWMCHPTSRETGCRPRVKHDMPRWGLPPRPGMIRRVG